MTGEAAMDRDAQRRLDAIRAGRSELENSGIDEFVAGRVSRRDFLRWGTVVGISLPTLALILEACGGTNPTTTGGAIKKGGRLNVGHQTPAGAPGPPPTNHPGRPTHLRPGRERLSRSRKDLNRLAGLATSLAPHNDGHAVAV